MAVIPRFNHMVNHGFTMEIRRFIGRKIAKIASSGKSGMLENKSGNIYETRKDGGRVTMAGL